MFRSRRRAVIFPQSSHLELAAQLAKAWGNDSFAAPIGSNLLADAVAAHDRGYGLLDTLEVEVGSLDDWFACRCQCLKNCSSEPIVEALVARHNLYLADIAPEPYAERLRKLSSPVFEQSLSAGVLDSDDIERLFSIQRFCDEVSYRLCFEKQHTETMKVWSGPALNDWRQLSFDISEIAGVTPWPFATSALRVSTVAYAQEGYPVKLEPIEYEFLLCPLAK